jgi:iron(III) transport system permease protein
MEILNDYGAAKYFGINTFSTGIFTSWFSLKDLPSAIRLSGFLLLFVGLIFLGERLVRGRASFAGSPMRPATRKTAQTKTVAFTISLLIIMPGLGFILPMIQLIPDAIKNISFIAENDFLDMARNSFFLAVSGSTAIVIAAYGILFAKRINTSPSLQVFAGISALGYAVPGAVLAVAIGYYSNQLDNFIGIHFIAASAGTIVFAYMVRFMAIGYNTIDSGMEGIQRRTEMASFSLGQSPLKTLRRVNLPISGNILGGAFILCFIDIVKELPLTYILRPFNFNTFATKAFDYASDEMLAKASVPALFIILLSLVPVVFLERKMRTR